MIRYAQAGRERAPVASKIFHDIAAKSEAIHDVRELRRVRQADGMPAFMQAGEVHHGVAKERIAFGYGIDIRTEARHIGDNKNRCAALAIDHNRTSLSVKRLRSPRPIDANAGAFFFGS